MDFIKDNERQTRGWGGSKGLERKKEKKRERGGIMSYTVKEKEREINRYIKAEKEIAEK